MSFHLSKKTNVRVYCYLPYYQMIVTSDGNVVSCCDQMGSFGNIRTQSLESIWNATLAKEMREAVRSGELHPMCKLAGTCRYLNQVMVHKDRPFLSEPKKLEICLPDSHCNIGGANPSDNNPACLMCKRNFLKPSSDDLTEEICASVKHLVPQLCGLRVLGTAEPFWRNAIFRVLDCLNFANHKNHIEVVCNTNGICVTPSIARRFFKETKYTDVWWSFDAATADTYKKIRRKDLFHHVAKNFTIYNSYRKDHGLTAHRAEVYNNINMLNVREMSAMVEQAKEMGADGIIFIPTMNYYPVCLPEITINEKNKGTFKEEVWRAKEKAKQLRFPIDFMKSFVPFPSLEVPLDFRTAASLF